MTTVLAHLKLETHINDEIICVSECVPDSVKKRIYITSAYKKGSTDQLLNMDYNESPQLTSKTSFGDDATIDSISDLFDFVKKYDAEEKAPIWFTASRLQLPHAVQTIISANSIIPDSPEKVNTSNQKFNFLEWRQTLLTIR